MMWTLAVLLAQAAAPRSGIYVLPPLTSTTLGGVKGTGAALVCSGTDKVIGFNASGTLQCGVDVGGSASPGGVSGNVQVNDGAGGFGAYTGTSCAYAVKTLTASGAATCTAAPTIPADTSAAHYVTTQAEAGLSAEAVLPTCTGTDKLTFNGTTISCAADVSGSGAPTTAQYWVGAPDGTLSAEKDLSALATALVINTGGVPSAYAGATSCTNQFFTGLSATGASTCTTDTLASAQHANQGTTTTLLHGNAAGNPAWSAVSLTADVTGILPAANGGVAGTECKTLGTATGATTTVGPVIWTGTFTTFIINYEIKGYNGGTPVGRILVGAASISTTALTNGSSMSEGIAGTLTNALSIPGAPLAVTLSAIGRSGTMHIRGNSGSLKRYEIIGQNGNASVSAASTLFRSVGNFSDLGTNLPLQRAQLTVYDGLTQTAASAQTFTTGTTITVIGCP